MFLHARLQAEIFATFVLTELLVAFTNPFWRDYVNPLGLF